MLSIIFAVLAAAANAGASVLQRKGAMSAPAEGKRGMSVVLHQLRHKVWFGGFGLLIVAFLFQAAALSAGPLAQVQPILAIELPATLLLAALAFHHSLRRREWVAVAAMTIGLGVALAAAAPSAGKYDASGTAWIVACAVGAFVLGGTAVTGAFLSGAPRAALLGATAGGLFGFAAAFMTTVTHRAQMGAGELFSSWQLYAMAVAGVAALIELQQAYAAATLASAQPGVTIGDPVVATALGVFLFGERINLGWHIAVELGAVAVLIAGVIELSRSIERTGQPAARNSEPQRR